MRWLLFLLLLSNLLLLVIVLITFNRYKVAGKLKRRVFAEKRVPFIQESFKNNRNYSYYRDLYHLYPKRKRDGVMVGDSQVSAVAWDELLPEFSVGSMGIPGDTTAGVLFRVDDVYRNDPEWVGLLIGTNDILQGRSSEEALANVEGLIRAMQENRESVQLLIVSTPSFAKWVELSKQRNDQVRDLNLKMKRFAETQERVQWIDLHQMITDDNGYLKQGMTSDGVHLSSGAYALLRKELVNCISSLKK